MSVTNWQGFGGWEGVVLRAGSCLAILVKNVPARSFEDVCCGIIMVPCEARSYFCDVALVLLALCIAQIFLSVMEFQGGPSSSSASVVPSSEISLLDTELLGAAGLLVSSFEARKAW